MAQLVSSIAELRATLPNNPNPLAAILLGYYEKDDKAHVRYYWDNKSELQDNGGSVIAVKGVVTGRWLARFDAELDPRHFGAKGDGVKDDSQAFQAAIEFLSRRGGGVVRIGQGTFAIAETLRIPKGISLLGLMPQLSVLSVQLQDPESSLLQWEQAIAITDGNLSIKNLSVLDSRSLRAKAYAPAFDLDGMLNALVENCQFRDLGGGAIRISRASNTTIDNVYAFGCGKLLAKAESTFANLGVIHMDRVRGFANTLNLSNSYISNCSNAIGIHLAGHAIRVHNCTVESCTTLMKLGAVEHVSRNINVTGLYLENARVCGLVLVNLIGANFQNLYFRDSNVAKLVKHSVILDNCRDIHWENAALGEYGFNIKRTTTNITFEGCSGNYPKKGVSGLNDSVALSDNELKAGYFGTTSNLIEQAHTFVNWKGNASVSEPFLDQGFKAHLLKKTSKSQDIKYRLSGPFTQEASTVFSVYVLGACSLRIRAQRNGSYEDIVLRQFQASDAWRRIYVSGTIPSGTTAVQLHITPSSYGRDQEECLVAYPQFELGKDNPGPFLKTNAPLDNPVEASVNGPIALQGLYFGYGIEAPKSGTWNQGDRMVNSKPEVGAPLGWVCVSSGTPGTWRPYGLIS